MALIFVKPAAQRHGNARLALPLTPPLKGDRWT
jgi:hypothetical protein